jgi:hypothetical protein
MYHYGGPSFEEEDMKKVLMILAIAVAVFFAASFDCPDAKAGFADNPTTPPAEGVQPPGDGHGISGVCGGENSDGDPDDLGGGFRSSSRTTRQSAVEVKPPVPPLVSFMLSVQQVWLIILR